ncbi:MAG: trypsin-like peptidase domain-containing protein [Planctomycetes bacterium]|nr:trypsin-like peptidase domain-containing protein [Planctomycetota bacterium]
MASSFRQYILVATGMILIVLTSTVRAENDSTKTQEGSSGSQPATTDRDSSTSDSERPEYELFHNVAPGTTSNNRSTTTTTTPRYTPSPRYAPSSQPTYAPTPQPTIAPQTGDPIVNLYRKSLPGVVRLVIKRGDDVVYGSGFILGGKGIIVTSFHLIEGASRGVVTFHDGVNLLIEGVMAYDVKQDLAILKVDVGDMVLQPLTLSMDTPTVGSKVIALGNPEGFFGTAAEGCVTAVCSGDKVAEKHASLSSDMVADAQAEWVMTDALISMGNSGGPLVSDEGKVVGVSAWTWQADDLSPRVGFAASSRKIMDLVSRAELTARPLDTLAAEQFGKLPAQDMVDSRQQTRTAMKFGADWRPEGKLAQNKVAQEIGLVLSSLRCRKCSGTGTITIEVLRSESSNPAFAGIKRHIPKDVTCPDCGGSGQLITELTYLRLVRMTESIAQMNTRAISEDSLQRTLDAARDVLAKVAAGSPAELRTKGQLPTAADGVEPPIGQAAVFYATLSAKHTKAGKRIAQVRTLIGGKTVLVRLPAGYDPPVGRTYLISGLSAGTVTIQTDDGIFREMGVEAFGFEGIPAGK